MVSSYIEAGAMFFPSAHELTVLSTSSSVDDLSDCILWANDPLKGSMWSSWKDTHSGVINSKSVEIAWHYH